MTPLLTLQTLFQNHVLYHGPGMADQIVSTGADDADARLAIYSNAYRLRLFDVLREDYAKLAQLLGDGQFNDLARRYIELHPSHHRSVRWVGEQLPALLQEESPYREQPLLAELGRFELALRDAFDAEDCECVDIEQIAAIPPDAWPSMRLEVPPSFQRLECHWNSLSVWQALNQERLPPAPRRLENPVTLIVWRKDLNPRFRSLNVDEAQGLDTMCSGGDFEDLCSGLCKRIAPEQVPARAAGLLRDWASEGLIRRITCST